MQEDLSARQLDEIISGWADQVWDGQDWDDSRLRDYLKYDYWTPHIGLCTLSGFDYRCCNNGNNNAPAQFQFASALSPSAFMSYKNENIAAEEELLTRMNDDIDRLRGFWENCGKNIEGAKYAPADFIEWALSISFYPHWLNWAIKNNLYASKKTDSSNGKDVEETNSLKGTCNGDDNPWLIHNLNDPVAKEKWYIPARYFARKLLKDNPLLLKKRLILADNVKDMMKKFKVYKRGGKLQPSAETILKAFSNVNFG